MVGAEALKTGMETGLIPNSHVAPGTPPQPHSTANEAAKPSNCAALRMARTRPIAFSCDTSITTGPIPTGPIRHTHTPYAIRRLAYGPTMHNTPYAHAIRHTQTHLRAHNMPYGYAIRHTPCTTVHTADPRIRNTQYAMRQHTHSFWSEYAERSPNTPKPIRGVNIRQHFSCSRLLPRPPLLPPSSCLPSVAHPRALASHVVVCVLVFLPRLAWASSVCSGRGFRCPGW